MLAPVGLHLGFEGVVELLAHQVLFNVGDGCCSNVGECLMGQEGRVGGDQHLLTNKHNTLSILTL